MASNIQDILRQRRIEEHIQEENRRRQKEEERRQLIERRKNLSTSAEFKFEDFIKQEINKLTILQAQKSQEEQQKFEMKKAGLDEDSIYSPIQSIHSLANDLKEINIINKRDNCPYKNLESYTKDSLNYI